MKAIIATGAMLALTCSCATSVDAPAASVATAAPVEKAADDATVQQAANADDSEELICRKKKVTGSRLRQVEICKTKEQWANTFNSFRAVNRMKDAHSTNSRGQ